MKFDQTTTGSRRGCRASVFPTHLVQKVEFEAIYLRKPVKSRHLPLRSPSSAPSYPFIAVICRELQGAEWIAEVRREEFTAFSDGVYHQNTREMLMTFNLETTTRCIRVLGIGLSLDAFREVTFEEFTRCGTESQQRGLCRVSFLHGGVSPSY